MQRRMSAVRTGNGRAGILAEGRGRKIEGNLRMVLDATGPHQRREGSSAPRILRPGRIGPARRITSIPTARQASDWRQA